LRVSRKLIMRKAKAMHDEKAGEDTVAKNSFQASRGWLEKFMKRNCLSLRRRTTTVQKDPAYLVDRLVQYVVHVRRMSKKYQFNAGSILAMDETAVWADMTAPTTVSQRGEREIMLKSTGHEKVRISVCLTAKADGSKLKPFIVFGGAKRECKELNTEFKNKCVVVSSKNAWMNEELTLHYVQTVLGKFSFNRRLLAWDSFECHMMDSVKQELSKGRIENVIIPGGCTKYIQAPDVSWNKPFKSRMIDLYNEWMVEGVQQFTKGGNQKPPSRRKLVQWVLDAWNGLSTEMIIKSFKSCGLNLALDGSEDGQIHCFKEGSSCSSGATLMKKATEALEEDQSSDNPFEIYDCDVNESYESFHVIDEDSDGDSDIDIDIV